MAVHERIESDEELMENDAFYDCIADMKANKNVLREPQLNPALQFTNLQENRVRERAIEVKYTDGASLTTVQVI
jgi:hypothetical protein